MKYFTLFAALIFSTLIFAQTNSTNSNIQITGYAEMDVMPDIGIMTMNIKEIKIEFNEAISSLDKKTAKLKKQLSKLNFSKESIKTTSFQIHKNTFYDRNKMRDSGYVASQALIVKFNYSKERISEILSNFSEESVGMQLSFSFTLSDNLKKASRNKLIELASNDAQEKGALLAKSFGKELNEILNLSYGSSPISVSPPIYRTMEMGIADAKVSSYQASGFTPEFIKMSETIHASWSLK